MMGQVDVWLSDSCGVAVAGLIGGCAIVNDVPGVEVYITPSHTS
jgi:hypothetical protein